MASWALVGAMAVAASACGSPDELPGAVRRADARIALPAAPAFDAELAARIETALRERAGQWPVSRHVARDGTPVFTNRLIFESSVYLRRQAHEPVNWYPWGKEAFAAATRLGRPVFVSIGSASCPQCDAMSSQSFDDIDIAKVLNAHFVAIKVDRHELSQVSAAYAGEQVGVQGPDSSLGARPRCVWLTADQRPMDVADYLSRVELRARLRRHRAAAAVVP